MTRHQTLLGLVVASLCLFGCTSGTGGTDAGGHVGPNLDDDCNTMSDAQQHADCQLTASADLSNPGMPPDSGFIYPVGDKDWYQITVPAPLPATAIFQVSAGYPTNHQSPVTIEASLFDANGQAIVSGTDPKTNGKTAPVVLDTRITQAGNYYVLVQQAAGVNDPNKHEDDNLRYTVSAAVVPDPDPNETGDDNHETAMTSATEAFDGGTMTGVSGQGILATTGDRDRFSFDVTGTTPQIVYLEVDFPQESPPIGINAQYTLYLETGGQNGSGTLTQIATDYGNALLGNLSLQTARLVQPGHYVVEISGYKASATDPDAPGDFNFKYTLFEATFPDLDTNEPNNSPADFVTNNNNAFDFSGSSPSTSNTKTATSRISYENDQEWFQVKLPDNADNTRLHYLVQPATGQPAPRYPFKHIDNDRELSVIQPFGWTADGGGFACTAGCSPLVFDAMRDSYCGKEYAGCPEAQRDEGVPANGYNPPPNTELNNFEGIIPISPHQTSHFLKFGYIKASSYDDKSYTITLTWLPAGKGDSLNDGPRVNAGGDFTNAISTSISYQGGGYQPDPGNGALIYNGQTSWGGLPWDQNQSPSNNQQLFDTVGQCVAEGMPPNDDPSLPPETAPIVTGCDFDIPGDFDYYEINMPGGLPSTTTTVPLDDGGTMSQTKLSDASWSLAWDVDAVGPGPSNNLHFQFIFCEQVDASGNCQKWEVTQDIGYSSDAVQSWRSDGNLAPAYQINGNSASFSQAACACMPGSWLKYGKFYMKVRGVNRYNWGEATYHVRSALGDFAQENFVADGGASVACAPAPGNDAGLVGCNFCAQAGGSDPCNEVDADPNGGVPSFGGP